MTYAILSVYYTGWECGSSYFIVAIIPIIIYFWCYIFKGKKRLIILATLIIYSLMYIGLYTIFHNKTPLYIINEHTKILLNIFSATVMIISLVFYNWVYIFSSETKYKYLKSENKKLYSDVSKDLLTKLLNRRGFMPIIKSYMKENSDNHFCIAFCDIDNFKRINDTYGHECGDEVLKHVTRIIRKEMSGCEICRWGGEELVILMKDYDFEVAKHKMEYIRQYIEDNDTVFYNKHIKSTITAGIEEFSNKYKDPSEIIKKADDRMYYGKQNGNNIRR